MRELVERIGNTPLPNELKNLSDDELRELFVELGENGKDRIFGGGLLEAYAKEMRRRQAANRD